ncbi:zinc ribbon domain-containing protein [Candidatus Enterococcus murrayae]|uniref:Zinc-ribbon domain-containing protein n=1 Tax=Candidatus Enterococcus murrayae TaxID=2815321 RepID=A0ABS3HMI3_9ENTE|nr:zinc-ribbon domain-containing protein [Enterococcus sp. MJM16]MBO0454124.1 zinc-ribbon domain-containing protein [Enterococcus sp. MJM16]
MKNCSNCGHENVSEARFCEECGQPFTAAASVKPEVMAEEEKSEAPEAKRFCPNCGESIPSDADFCPNCGHQIKTIVRPAASPKKTLSKKQKIGIGAGVMVVVLFAFGFLFGRYYYSYPQQLSRLERIFKTQDPEKIAEVVVSEDPNYQVSAANLKKFVSYYQESNHKADFADFLTDLKNNPGQLDDFSVQEKGKHLGLFPRYQLVIQPVYLTVTTDQAGMQLSLDGEKLATSKGSNYQTTWGPLTPGSYQVEGKLDSEKSAAKQALVRYHNPEFETDSHVAINLHKISFKVTSNVDGAQVLLNDKEVGTIEEGQAEIKDVVWHQGMEVQLAFKTASDQLKSDTYRIAATEFLADDYKADSYASEIHLDFDNVQSTEDVQIFLDRLYSDLSSYSSKYSDFGASEKSDLAEHFVNGASNADEKDFEKFINEFRTSAKKSRVNAKAKVESVSMTGKDVYTVQYLIYYDTIYTDATDDVSQVFRYKKATLSYNKDEATFQIDNLGGAENFETVDSGDA